jgi:hypothetical protein
LNCPGWRSSDVLYLETAFEPVPERLRPDTNTATVSPTFWENLQI